MEIPQRVRDRFIEKYFSQSNDCWIWPLSSNNMGYGQVGWKLNDRKNVLRLAHRVSYEIFVGSIPEGLVLDHLCRTPLCINPNHLEPVTQRENMLRGNSLQAKYAKRDHCNQGHKYPVDIRLEKDGSRRCKICRNARERLYYARG